MPAPHAATNPALLTALTRDRIVELGRQLGVPVPVSLPKADQARRLAGDPRATTERLARAMTRDELRAACEALGLDADARSRRELAERLLGRELDADAFRALPVATPDADALPKVGDRVRCRERQYLVTGVQQAQDGRGGTVVELVSLEDDDDGATLVVLWELELGARVLAPTTVTVGDGRRLDDPSLFGAYLQSLRWNTLTATDPELLQAPFRAGIHLFQHQITPLARALAMPRANLFVADDVGLGKTIEAGLVVQEMILRQQVNFVLIVAPASVTLQWRDEMAKRFGLDFVVYDRDYVQQQRRERGFGVNPWATHSRFIVSYHTAKRPEHADNLYTALGQRAGRSMLILDEAHTVAPATATAYAVSSELTRFARRLAPRFENRLFLSATPHNGHSNSFAALLHMLDPQRFLRGEGIDDPAQLDHVMVRRLKSDLRDAGTSYPRRRVVRIALKHTGAHWRATADDADPAMHRDASPLVFGDADDATLPAEDAGELDLARQLAAYSRARAASSVQRPMVLITLQQRLLSSVPAFAATLDAHRRNVAKDDEAAAAQGVLTTGDDGGANQSAAQAPRVQDADTWGDDEARREADLLAEVARASEALGAPAADAAAQLDALIDAARSARYRVDAKQHAFTAWLRAHACPALGTDDAAGATWSPTRVLVFTEHGATLRHLERWLVAMCADTHLGHERIMTYHGGMDEAARDRVQRAFNADPADHPVRILLATDAAREGVNLQASCADLFHWDLPWNPAKIEQRNGRIDRTLQPSPEVRCHYFHYVDRAEDRVLDTVMRKIETIRRELGSVGTVVLDHIEETLRGGIDDDTAARLDDTGTRPADEARKQTAQRELETTRADDKRLAAELDTAARLLKKSRHRLQVDAVLLREVVDAGCRLVAGAGLEEATIDDRGERLTVWRVPAFPKDWQLTLDTLRPARLDEAIWEWRERPLLPVVFAAPSRLTTPVVQLHLSHPFVARLLEAFRAAGGDTELVRAAAVRSADVDEPRAIALGRLCLFGTGGERLHDEIVVASAPWREAEGVAGLEPDGDAADEVAMRALAAALATGDARVDDATRERLARLTPDAYRQLWQPLHDEADALADEAGKALDKRGETEAHQLATLLEQQRDWINDRIGQLELPLDTDDPEQRRERDADARALLERRDQLERDRTTEPAQLRARYRVGLRRFEAVGLVWLWPATR